jgi:hypothetical protein
MNNFETGALKDAQDAFNTAEGAMEGKTAGTQEFIDAEKALQAAEKRKNRAEEEFFQLQEDHMRSDNQLFREEEKSGAQAKIDEAKGFEAYYIDVIAYYNQKLHWLNTIEEALDLSDEGDYEFFMQIQPEKDNIWEMLD